MTKDRADFCTINIQKRGDLKKMVLTAFLNINGTKIYTKHKEHSGFIRAGLDFLKGIFQFRVFFFRKLTSPGIADLESKF